MSDKYPHEILDSNCIPWNSFKGAFVAQWTSDFDCSHETQFWYCIKDNSFDISKLKAKRRYEINKGIKNFNVCPIDPKNYLDDLYQVYLGKMNGYKNPKILDKEVMDEKFLNIQEIIDKKECVFFGCFKKENNKLCGYSDVYLRGKYLPISSFNTIEVEENRGVNFALMMGILNYFKDDIVHGSYLCDGARNVLHDTNFQNFLIKYFQFRRAYCILKIKYKKGFGIIIKILYPLRKIIKNKKIQALLRMEAWSRGLEE